MQRGQFVAYIEHFHKGGPDERWECYVEGLEGLRYFLTKDNMSIYPKSGAAARWLCEFMMTAAELGLLQGYEGE